MKPIAKLINLLLDWRDKISARCGWCYTCSSLGVRGMSDRMHFVDM